MGFVRCTQHEPEAKKYNYVGAICTVGYPNTAAVCPRDKCHNPGLLYVTESEYKHYKRGRRVFNLLSESSEDAGTGAAVRVGNRVAREKQDNGEWDGLLTSVSDEWAEQDKQ